MTAIWRIRRDLRLTDNAALQAALEVGSVIPAFILDPAFSRSSPRRKNFLAEEDFTPYARKRDEEIIRTLPPHYTRIVGCCVL